MYNAFSPVNPSNPANKAAPTNRGLVSAWSGLVDPFNSAKLRDIIGPNNAATGSRSVGVAGRQVNNFTIASPVGLDLSTNFSVAAYWDCPGTLPSGYNVYPIIYGNKYASESSNSGWALRVDGASYPSPGYEFQLYNNSAGTYSSGGYSSVTPGPHLLVGTTDGTTKTIYLDGVSVGTSSYATAGLTGNTAVSFGPGVYWAGVYNRSLSAADVLALYKEIKQRYAISLNRVGSSVLLARQNASVLFRRTLSPRVGTRGGY